MSEKRKKLKERFWEFVSNINSIAEVYKCSKEEAVGKVVQQIKEINYVRFYAGIVHDKDLNEDGAAKAEHVHIVLVLTCPVTAQTIAGKLGMPEQTVNRIYQKKQTASGRWITDVGGALSYLTHRNASEKHQYSDAEVFASEGWDWKQVRSKSETAHRNSDVDQIIDGIICGKIKQYNFTDFVEPDTFVQPQIKRKIEAAFDYRNNLLLKEHSRNILCMYFYGEQGTGKTSLAKIFAEEHNLSYYVSGSSSDPLDSYRGEDVLIIDDARPSMFQPEEWLRLLDNNTRTLAHSRYHDKIVEAKYIILTSSMPLYNFFSSYANEDARQLYRRIKIWAYITKDQIELYEWNRETGSYKLFDTGINPIYLKFDDSDTSLSEEEKQNITQSLLIKKGE